MIASKHLRDISTTAPPLWTHIDLVIGSPHEEIYMRYASACLRYSGRLHLQVHIVENQTKRIPQTAGLVGLLAPHADRIASLDLQISAPLAREIMLGLFSHPALYQLRGLCLSDGDCNFDPEFCDRFFEGHLGESLRSLQALAVLGPLVPLDSPAYHGLTVLKLVPQKLGMFHPTLLQLAGALEGSPKLRSLSLIGCTFQAISDASIQPVSLPDLELLDLRRIRANQLLDLISSIALGSKKLAFSMSFDPEMARHDITTLQHFLQNSKITRLCIHNTLNDGNLNWLFRVPADVLARVHELALDHYNFMHGQVEARALGVDRFPLLHTLHLLGCRLDLNRCRQLLDSSTIQVLQTEQVHYYKDLSGVVPHVKYRQYAAICQGEGDLEWPVYAI
ncbi:hypothetical protein FRC08_003235 [Ceratobasidium sp. 394]|nr:hypothetical protein FRC08_003235 [Ceratobasidium sp. 394]KAG9088368.1 hypothetical protein FS749_002220 [Ceratobasidium sp. UAMH 11750]